MHGNPSLFVREDTVEAAWSVVEPILGNVTPVYEYDPHTWGPAEADRIIAASGGWHNPTEQAVEQ
jgi:glucose-6-phosphate 1-dehydrogenase